jgi:hypothetical protein
LIIVTVSAGLNAFGTNMAYTGVEGAVIFTPGLIVTVISEAPAT